MGPAAYASATAGPETDPVTVTRPDTPTDLSLRFSPELHSRLSEMFADYGIGSLEEGALRSLGLWRYLDRVLGAGGQLVVIDPRQPHGPFDVIDLRSW